MMMVQNRALRKYSYVFRVGFMVWCCLGGMMSGVAQQNAIAKVIGTVIDGESSESIEFVTVYIRGDQIVTETNAKGRYELSVPANETFELVYSRIGYREASQPMQALLANSVMEVNVSLVSQMSDVDIEITARKIEDAGMIREDVEELKLIPSTSGNFESILPSIALGTTSGTGGELSSQYNVRGGNYDENLVYVNDFEIFRPQLIRSGQQEGLSFPNIDLIRDLSFSSGGFEAKYGDKMSSVLDIRYKRPTEFKSSVGLSLLGASAHIEGSKQIGKSNYQKFRYLVGARYKNSRYLLGSLDTKGEYLPNFADIQSYLTYDINRDFQLAVLSNYNRSEYNFIPRESATGLGLIDFSLRLSSVFEGAERDKFENGILGMSLTYLPERKKNPYFLKLLASNYQSVEQEYFDILGFYRLSQIETNLGSENVGEEVAVLGTGTQHIFARNQLFNRVRNIQHRGGIELQNDGIESSKSHFLQWGIKVQNEFFDDELNEWERLDSAGYSLPFDPNSVQVNEVLKSVNQVESYRFSGFVEDGFSYLKEDVRELKFTIGTRFQYWDLNKQFLVSPRAQLLYKPLNIDKEISFKLAGGVYYQSPFYREMRRPDGSVNRDLKAQKSIHVVGGLTYDFDWKNVSDKKFRLITELFYKKLDNLVSYEVDNVRIRYSGENDASGYIAGLDLRLNGEFVPGAESWVNLSILRARERLNGIQHLQRTLTSEEPIPVNYARRPSDQFVNVNIFFQDYLPRNENFKMHLNLVYGTGLPFGLKGNNEVYRNVFKFKSYRRVDLGFSFLLWNQSWKSAKPNHFFRAFENVWMSLEVFNLMDIENEASKTWIKTVYNTQYAIPNNLTGRRLNLRVKVDF